MLRHTSKIDGYAIGATDGPIGAITDFLFDDVTWLVRWLVVDTSEFLADRRVLLPPSVLGHVNHIGRQFSVRLTKQQVRDSPNSRAEEPVSRSMETDLYDYYGWSPYWSTGFNMGGYGFVDGLFPPSDLAFSARIRQQDRAERGHGDVKLRSVRKIVGYNIHAHDGEVGQIADFLLEDGDWSIHYLVVDTQGLWPGKKVLISPRSIEGIDWATSTVNLNVDRRTIKNSPAYDGSQAVDRAYEYQFHGYYDGRRVTEPV